MTWTSARPGVPHASPAPREPDPVAVERIAAGQRPARYTAGEMRAAVELLTARGMSSGQVAARIGCTRRTVQRYRRLCEADLVRREWYEAGRVEAERPARGAA
jgi:hypothetical protein